MENKKIFWIDNFSGEATGGFFIRNDLKTFIDNLEENGLNPVGISYDGTLNLEIIVERNQAFIDKYENNKE